jgi:ketosteroid isomerase-like protein
MKDIQSFFQTLARTQTKPFMKTIASSFLFFCIFSLNSIAQTPNPQQLLELDQGWENALLKSDVVFLENLLADDFIWVHNHAGQIDGKEEAVSRAKRIQSGQADDTRGRVSRDQQVVILGNTGVVSGYTVVDRGPKPVTYHFMRTYVLVDGKFKLLANHTMAIPDEEVK